MITLESLNDERNNDPAKYLSTWNHPESRQTAFLRGWTIFLKDGTYEKKAVTWQTVGAFYASIFGRIVAEKRRVLYFAALTEFVKSQRCSGWSNEQRLEALRLARQAPGFGPE